MTKEDCFWLVSKTVGLLVLVFTAGQVAMLLVAADGLGSIPWRLAVYLGACGLAGAWLLASDGVVRIACDKRS